MGVKQEDKPVTWIYQLGEDKALKETPKSHAGITQEVFKSIMKISGKKSILHYFLFGTH